MVKIILNTVTNKYEQIYEEQIPEQLLYDLYKNYIDKVDSNIENISRKYSEYENNLNKIYEKLIKSRENLNNILKEINIIQSKKLLNLYNDDGELVDQGGNKIDLIELNIFYNDIKLLDKFSIDDKELLTFTDYYNNFDFVKSQIRH